VLVERAYLILYELHPDMDDGPVKTIEIVRVVDGRRELSGLF
jgi:toxin ParE1/3/4